MLVRVASAEAASAGSTAAAEAGEATAATAAALVFLAAGLVIMAVSVWCPELPQPLGGPEVMLLADAVVVL